MEHLYKVTKDFIYSDSLYLIEITMPRNQVWELVGVKPNGNVLKRGNTKITVTNELASAYFDKV